MVAEAEVVVRPKSLPVLEVQYFDEIEPIGDAISPTLNRVRASESVSAELSSSQSDIKPMNKIPDSDEDLAGVEEFVPSLRSGSFADIGPRRYMEDEHVNMED